MIDKLVHSYLCEGVSINIAPPMPKYSAIRDNFMIVIDFNLSFPMEE